MINIKRGRQSRRQKVVIYGPEGVGKSTLASQLPNPVFIDTEGSTAQLDVARVDVNDWKSLTGALAEIHRMSEFETVILDTVDWAERMATTDLLNRTGKASIEDFGYGKGWVQVAEEMGKLLGNLDQIVRGGKHVVLLAHSKVVRFAAPDLQGEHDRFELKLSKQCSPLVKEWADAILFLNFKTRVVEVDGKKRGIGGKERALHASHTAAYDAKNRHGLADQIEATAEALAPIFTPTTPVLATSGHLLDLLMAGFEQEANAYLLARRWITDGQTFRDLAQSRVDMILQKPDRFLEAVKEGGAK
jgi:energy-coupling factor transporter ATP-binding protein EcfA2